MGNLKELVRFEVVLDKNNYVHNTKTGRIWEYEIIIFWDGVHLAIYTSFIRQNYYIELEEFIEFIGFYYNFLMGSIPKSILKEYQDRIVCSSLAVDFGFFDEWKQDLFAKFITNDKDEMITLIRYLVDYFSKINKDMLNKYYYE